jgi:Xaa-Pro aminopeptidase
MLIPRIYVASMMPARRAAFIQDDPMLMHTHEARLDALRKQLAQDGLDGFVIPISDEHMSEYVGAYAQRLAWLTGFGGSAGTAVVLRTKPRSSSTGAIPCRCASRSMAGSTAISRCRRPAPPRGWGTCAGRRADRLRRLAARPAVGGSGGERVVRARRAAGAGGGSRRCGLGGPARAVDRAGAGSWRRTRRPVRVRKARGGGGWLAERKLDAVVVSALDSIAWLLNIRGADVERTPVALSFVLAHADGTADLFIAPEKVTPALVSTWATRCVSTIARRSCPRWRPWRASVWRSTRNAPSRRSSPRSIAPGPRPSR